MLRHKRLSKLPSTTSQDRKRS